MVCRGASDADRFAGCNLDACTVCSCVSDGFGGTLVNCTARNLVDVPCNIPNTVPTIMYASFLRRFRADIPHSTFYLNFITSIQAGDFSYTKLVEMCVTWCACLRLTWS